MVGDWWSYLVETPPELLWGLFMRGVGAIYVISFLSLLLQVVNLAGRGGAVPIARRLDKIQQDFPAPQRYLYFPTLLWINSGHTMLRLLPIVGLAAACVVIYGGPLGFYGLLVCYVCYVSLDMPMGLIFPWDCLLFETTVLSMFLPGTLPLPELAAAALPAPSVAWALRILLFRVILGFGKTKFLGATSKDSVYLRGFLTAQPLPSILGWYMQKAPLWVLRSMLYFMFFVEIPGAVFMLIPGDLSVVAAVATALLMVGIISFGSFGYFSPLTIVLCLPLLDNQTPLQLSLGSLLDPQGPWLANLFVVFHTLAALVVFPYNSWVAQSWSHWTMFLRVPARALALPFDLLRMLHPFRLVHPYGVFPPHAFPAEKASLIAEVSWDGDVWYECDFKYFPTQETSRPVFVAPHHPRGDQAVIYETYGLNPTTMISAMAGPWEPYTYGTHPAAIVLCQHLLEGKVPRFVRCAELERRSVPPTLARMRTILLQPATLSELREEGKYWRRRVIGPHTPDRRLDPQFWEYLLPEPEMWHPEAAVWRRRSHLSRLMDRAVAGEPVNQAVIADTPELTPADVEMFWTRFIGSLGDERHSWTNLPDSVSRVRATFDRPQRRVLERLMGRFSVMLEAKLQPLYLYQGLRPARLPAKTYLHLWMLIQHIICKGKDTFEAVLAEPEMAAVHLSDLSVDNGTYVLSLFRFETMIFDAQKLRLVEAVLGPYGDRQPEPSPLQQKLVALLYRLFGYFEVADRLKQSFRGPQYDGGYPERYPVFHVRETGEVRLRSWAPD